MKHSKVLCTICFWLFFAVANATPSPVIIEAEESESEEMTEDAESEAAGMEEFDDERAEIDDSAPVILSEDDYKRRLAKLPQVINLPYNNIVRNYIMLYTGRKFKRNAEEILGLSEYYFPIFEHILDQYGLPLEFKYLSVIESALNPHAVSRVGATGLWQFMYGTAKLYGVIMTTTVDERRDPVIATHAAARHFKDLYEVFQDWTLVLAAYNCGQGNVKKAMRRSGKSDFWGIYNYLPRETRGYVPAFIGASYMLNYYKEHNLTPKKFDFSPLNQYEVVKINKWVHFDQISAFTGVPPHILRDLNPQYRRDIIPGNEKIYPLKIPITALNNYIDNEENIPFYKSDLYNPVLMAAPVASVSTYYASYSPPPSGAKRIRHTVRTGETLGTIANLYRVRINDLRAWNRIRGNTIYAGKRLNIYVKQGKSTAQGKNNSDANLITQSGHLCYQVKNGDTLWNISQRYKYLGINMETIKNLNGINDDVTLSTGQMLKIKKI